MTSFKYAAKGPGGKTVEGQMEAEDRNEVLNELRRQNPRALVGLHTVSATSTSARGFWRRSSSSSASTRSCGAVVWQTTPSRGAAHARTSSADQTTTGSVRSSTMPRTSTWPGRPITTTRRPSRCSACAASCTFCTSGHVVSTSALPAVRSRARSRSLIPCAVTRTAGVSGTPREASSDCRKPRASSMRRTSRLWTSSPWIVTSSGRATRSITCSASRTPKHIPIASARTISMLSAMRFAS